MNANITLLSTIETLTEQRDQLLHAARLAQSVIGGRDTSGAGQRAAHAALFVALANCEASNPTRRDSTTAQP